MIKRATGAAVAVAMVAGAQAEQLPITVAASIQITGTITIDTGQFLGGLIRDFTGASSTNINRAIVEYDLSSVSGATVQSALATADVVFRQSRFGDSHDWAYYLYPADGEATVDDFDPVGAILVGSDNTDGTGHSISLDVATALQTIIDGGATHVGFQVRAVPNGDGRALSELESPVLDVVVDTGGDPCICETDGEAAQVDVFDLLSYLDLWFASDAAADLDGAPGVDVFDLLFYLDCWFPASAGTPCP